ncbi:hypothetical protein CJD36_004380 [Flavipsychrobacter stenotrophus]|uniref:HTH cro/C1-type domain-containing protein n=1 Tax=Flavipsychrobacter stenotrophus TaxID=2077091 RepID=A0A2S7T2B9_9BACT|nr:helix-turn-helix transcriptional regulator [Flavipsychrobacter stenotrophus]PQJ12987.1 hypothetical protein CJD36_004380 [Flavipsychrobacter stenotrophus]
MTSRIPSLGEQLRKHRALMGYSIREAAKEAKIAPIRLSQWERNLRKPSIENISILAVVYRVLIDELCVELRHKAVQKHQTHFGIHTGSDKPP